MSLKDRFTACREAGEAGIPRQELLGHVRDAADALDFINVSQSLQHLDIKGENLLLVGGRLNLGDFGLMRNLSEQDAALLDGMTPRYSAPELFKGQPTKYSDQYSLAVVYAELLTGQTLFEARTPAEFAVQHLIGAKPRLEGLCRTIKPSSCAALRRNPDERYPNCREFVDSLAAETNSAIRQPAATTTVPATAASEASFAKRTTGGPTQPVAESAAPPPASRQAILPTTDDLTVVLTASSETRQTGKRSTLSAGANRLPPLVSESQSWQARPTLFIGVGGAAGLALGRLRKRLEERFLFADRIPLGEAC